MERKVFEEVESFSNPLHRCDVAGSKALVMLLEEEQDRLFFCRATVFLYVGYLLSADLNCVIVWRRGDGHAGQ